MGPKYDEEVSGAGAREVLSEGRSKSFGEMWGVERYGFCQSFIEHWLDRNLAVNKDRGS